MVEYRSYHNIPISVDNRSILIDCYSTVGIWEIIISNNTKLPLCVNLERIDIQLNSNQISSSIILPFLVGGKEK